MSTVSPTHTPLTNREANEAKMVGWSSWRICRTLLGYPPWEVMEWLHDFYVAMESGVETAERYIACGGLGLGMVETCDCEKPKTGDAAAALVLEAEKCREFNGFVRIYEQLAWESEERLRVKAIAAQYLEPRHIEALMRQCDGLTWLHANHRLYNRAKKAIIESTIGLTALRAILERDLAVEDSDLGPEWGNLLRKDYAREVIAHFVNSHDWC